MKRFNIRVYGVVINEQLEVLLSDESYRDLKFTKFPGGGLEWGEGTVETLKREFLEEFNLNVEVGELLYLNDFFQVSAFNFDDQLVSIYYRVFLPENAFIQTIQGDKTESLRWRSIYQLHEEELTFPVDKKMVEVLKMRFLG